MSYYRYRKDCPAEAGDRQRLLLTWDHDCQGCDDCAPGHVCHLTGVPELCMGLGNPKDMNLELDQALAAINEPPWKPGEPC
ncbi:hypothetical protein ACWDFH_12370 [Streptomyces kronopolitis]